LQAARGESALARGEAAAVGGELQSTRNELQSARAELDARGGELAGLRDELAAARAEAGHARGELETVRAELERTRGELDASQSAADDVRAEREQVKLRAQQLLHEAERARAAADAIRAEFAFDPEPAGAGALPPHATPADAERSPWSVPVTSEQPAPPAAPALPDVEPGQAAALISLDGQFRRLDEAFCSLLGCREEDLRAARWPSIIDRENLEPHQEIARAAGRRDPERGDRDGLHARPGAARADRRHGLAASRRSRRRAHALPLPRGRQQDLGRAGNPVSDGPRDGRPSYDPAPAAIGQLTPVPPRPQ
ncbi:MAG: hypothetical protein KY433_06880, partial [Actinobacteria bacterium]|nr:hypothetical protein [Actinomycetota bacterium]